jgi:hypothetical protein
MDIEPREKIFIEMIKDMCTGVEDCIKKAAKNPESKLTEIDPIKVISLCIANIFANLVNPGAFENKVSHKIAIKKCMKQIEKHMDNIVTMYWTENKKSKLH